MALLKHQKTLFSLITIIISLPLVFRSYLLKALSDFYINYKHKKISIQPDPSKTIIKSINDFCKANGAQFIIGFRHHNEEFEKFFSENNIRFIKLKEVEVFSSHGFHWTPDGHKKIAEQLFTYLSPLLN